MYEARPDTERQPSSPTTERGSGILGRLSVLSEPHWLAVVLFLAGVLVSLAYGPFLQREVGDSAIYDYIAQSMLRGQMPYRDVIEMKSPGSLYPSIVAIAVGRLTGLGDVRAIRLLYVLLAGVFSAVIFLTAHIYLRSRMAGVLASLLALSVSQVPLMLNGGTEPKLLMMIFGLISMMLILRDRPFWSGLFSMLSCLCWQPGLMFTGLAFLLFSRYLTSWRDLRALKVLLGAAIPLAMVALHFYLKGALSDLWSWTIVFNYSVFRPESQRSLGAALLHLGNVIRRVFKSESLAVGLAVVGWGLLLVQRVRAKLKSPGWLSSPDLYRDALLIPFLIYFAFSLINFQGGPDLIPFVPFFGIFFGWLLVEAGRWLGDTNLCKRLFRLVPGRIAIPGAAVTLLIMLTVYRAATYKQVSWTLQQQEKDSGVIAGLLGPGDNLYVHGAVDILVFLNRPNPNPYIALDGGADLYVAAHKPGGFADVINEIESAKPKIVVISRLRNVRRRAEIEKWVEDHYDQLDLTIYDGLYARKRDPQ